LKTIFIIVAIIISGIVYSQSPDTLYPVKAFTESGYKHGFINNQGYLSIKPQYAFAKSFSEGLAFVKLDNNSNKWMCINTTGNIQFEIETEYITDFKSGIASFGELNNLSFIDTTGNITTFKPPTIDFESKKTFVPFYDNLKWGYRLGPDVVVLPAIYERAGEFSEGLAPVFIMFSPSDLPSENCYNAFINENGDVIIKAELKYDDKGFLESGYFYSPENWVNGVCRYYTSNNPLTRVEKYIRSDGKVIW